MVLNTPIINAVSCFDPRYAFTFEFQYQGVQIIKNRAVIRNNTTSSIIYDKTQDGMRYNHVLPANALLTNTGYTIQIQVFDAEGNSSNLSEAVLFHCYLTPEFSFSNVNKNDKITSANFEAKLKFTQSEGDSLKECVFYLYGDNKTQVSQTYYSTDNLSYTYYGLSNLSPYEIRAIGKTLYGFTVDTGYIPIQIEYQKIPSTISFLGINNSGKITLASNIVITDYTLNNNDYTISDGFVTIGKNNLLTYHVSDINDFTKVIRVKSLPMGTFLDIIGEKYTAHVAIKKMGNICFAVLTSDNTLSHYVLYRSILGKGVTNSEGSYIVDTSNNILRILTGEYNTEAIISFTIKRKNNVYELSVNYS